jgi:hypothetical protein
MPKNVIPSLKHWQKHDAGQYTFEDQNDYHWEISPWEWGFNLAVRKCEDKKKWIWITLDSKVAVKAGVSFNNLFNTPALAAKAASKVQL